MCVFPLLQLLNISVTDKEASHRVVREDWCWPQRLNVLLPSPPTTHTLLAVRRALFTAGGLQELVADSWLSLSHSLKQRSCYDAARVALKQAEAAGLEPATVLLEECALLKVCATYAMDAMYAMNDFVS